MWGFSNDPGAGGGSSLPGFNDTGGGTSAMNSSSGGDTTNNLSGAGVYGALIDGVFNWFGQREANKTNKQIAMDTNVFNADQAEKNRKFQAEMSNTAYQRQMEDLMKAGINPLLMTGMSGASTPSGSTASGVQAHVENEMTGAFSSAKQALATGMAFQKLGTDIGLTQDQQALTKAQTKKAAMETAVMSKGIPEADIKNRVYNYVNDFFGQPARTAAPKNTIENKAIQTLQKFKTGGFK